MWLSKQVRLNHFTNLRDIFDKRHDTEDCQNMMGLIFAYIMNIDTTVMETRQAVNPESLRAVNF